MSAYIKVSLVTLRAAFIIIFFTILQGQFFPLSSKESGGMEDVITSSLLCLMPLAILIYCFKFLPAHLEVWISKSSEVMEAWVNKAPQPALKMSVVILAGLTLFLELVLIRWQTGLFPVFALYKNFILLACFCGIGLGYALSRNRPLFYVASMPLMAMTILMMVLLRYGSGGFLLLLLQSPDIETGILRIMLPDMGSIVNAFLYLPTLLLLSGAFVLNVLILIPVSQFCGVLMDRIEKPLASYGCNLLGSIGGVVLLFVLSLFWGGPVIWFGLSIAVLLWYQMYSVDARQAGLVSAAIIITVLAWPVSPLVQNIYSPYQLIQKTAQEDSGLTWLLASGSYHQHAHNLSLEKMQHGEHSFGFFELAYNNAPSLDRVLIMGAGIGNDVAAALKAGAKTVDAVEIDPAIIEIGRITHPENPYQDERVNAITDDGRGFVRSTDNKYDLITYGLQDTTIVMSLGTNVRFDTYLFTKEGLFDSYSRLNPGGIMSVAYMFPDETIIDNKIYRILKRLPEASDPVVVSRIEDFDGLFYVNFMVRKGVEFSIPPSYIKRHNLEDISHDYQSEDQQIGQGELQLPTDDWPFFLMEEKTFPFNYVMSSFLILFLSLMIVRKMLPARALSRSLMPYFFLGAGFMLIETKAIAELALLFGNTWQVIAITIIGVLTMAYLANLFVARTARQFLVLSYIGLFGVIAVGFFVFITGGLPYQSLTDKLLAIALLVSPLFFSGIIFSTLLKQTEDISGAMAYNIMGAMLGGLLEYSAMRFGFSSLYLIGLAVYGVAWLASLPLKPPLQASMQKS